MLSDATGLVANTDKLSCYGAGIDDETKKNFLSLTGFSAGTLPFRYLGLPLSSKKWSKVDCHVLVERITSRVTTGYFKSLSYAGRLQVIIAVIFFIYNYWGALFILPQSIIKKVDKICQDFLWGCKTNKRKIAMVSRDTVCAPKKYGGLYNKNSKQWNIASVGKLIWQLAGKDTPQVKWVHGIYMRSEDKNFWEHQVPADCS